MNDRSAGAGLITALYFLRIAAARDCAAAGYASTDGSGSVYVRTCEAQLPSLNKLAHSPTSLALQIQNIAIRKPAPCRCGSPTDSNSRKATPQCSKRAQMTASRLEGLHGEQDVAGGGQPTQRLELDVQIDLHRPLEAQLAAIGKAWGQQCATYAHSRVREE